LLQHTGLPVARLLGADLDAAQTDVPALLASCLPGRLSYPQEPTTAFVSGVAQAAAMVHAQPMPQLVWPWHDWAANLKGRIQAGKGPGWARLREIGRSPCGVKGRAASGDPCRGCCSLPVLRTQGRGVLRPDRVVAAPAGPGLRTRQLGFDTTHRAGIEIADGTDAEEGTKKSENFRADSTTSCRARFRQCRHRRDGVARSRTFVLSPNTCSMPEPCPLVSFANTNQHLADTTGEQQCPRPRGRGHCGALASN